MLLWNKVEDKLIRKQSAHSACYWPLRVHAWKYVTGDMHTLLKILLDDGEQEGDRAKLFIFHFFSIYETCEPCEHLTKSKLKLKLTQDKKAIFFISKLAWRSN